VVALLVFVIAMVAGPGLASAQQPWMDPSLSPDQRADLLESQMTVADKVQLVTGDGVCEQGADGFVLGQPSLGIPNLNLTGGGQGVDNLCSASRQSDFSDTLLPAPIAMSASWDPQVAYADGELIGRETRDEGINVSIGGDVNLARDPRNGRTYEAEGEDPLLAGTMAGWQLRGTQSQHVIATIKHFAENNEEVYRHGQNSIVDERTMRELELRAFETGIKTSDAGAVMCSYNNVNGVPACQDHYLLTDVLKRDWGFRGWVMTDWWACGPLDFDTIRDAGSVSAGLNNQCTTQEAAIAGLDQEQPNANVFGPALAAEVAQGAVPIERLNDMVHRILRTMFKFGLFDDPPVVEPLDIAAGAAESQRLEEQSAVLLKNTADLLPLDPSRPLKLAVIGASANTAPPQGAGSAAVAPALTDTPLQGISAVAPNAAVQYVDGSDAAAAAAAAQSADVAIVYGRDCESEDQDRANLALEPLSYSSCPGNPNVSIPTPPPADDVISAVAKANPRTVVVLMTGGPATMPWVSDVPGVLEAWYPGEYGGHAIARLLFGQVNPSGRLPVTFPVSEADLPTAASTDIWPGTSASSFYREGLDLGYRWYDDKGIAPLFPFGFGLTYGGHFNYSGLKISPGSVPVPSTPTNGHLLTTVSFAVRNAGTRAATEVPQVYVGFPAAVGEPPKRLVGWGRRQIAPGHTASFSTTIDDRALAYWNVDRHDWVVAPGPYPICVGASSRGLRLVGTLRLGQGGGSARPACTVAAPRKQG
jgi:beta-glucosidase